MISDFQEILLASASPRRAELLKRAGIGFTVDPVEVEEFDSCPDIRKLPELNAALKADTSAILHPEKLVLGADTMIIFENRAIGKPADTDDARAMLRAFSGQSHEVITGMALICREKSFRKIWSETSVVTFKNLDDETISRYLDQVEVLDKAGAYAIQEHADLIISSYTGELANIIGLPLKQLLLTISNANQ